MRVVFLYFLIAIFLTSCHSKQTTLFSLKSNTGINFNNKVKDAQLENGFTYRNYYNGGGVAIGDLNNDGLPDVFFTSNMGSNQIYLNKGNFKFKDITQKSGIKQDSMWSTGVTMIDINNDGWLDIYVCNAGHMKDANRKNKLYINNHDLTFTEAAAKYGLDVSAYTTQATFFDYDMDGDLDCFMIDNSPMPINDLGYVNRRDLPDKDWPVANFLKGGGDHLYRNDNGHFTEVTKQVGIHGGLISFGLGVSIGDVNNDGYPDIYVSNDSYERDYCYINQKNGTFRDDFENCFSHTSLSSMGSDIADINNDGYPEIFTTDMLPGDDYRLRTLGSFDNVDFFRKKVKQDFYYQYMKNCLQLNNKNGTFSDVANICGVGATDWSWGALLFDADNDGYNDIYVCNGVNRDVTNLDFVDFFANEEVQKQVLSNNQQNVDKVLEHLPQNPMINKAFRNKGNLMFEDVGKSWGFTQSSFSSGAAYADLDNDGDLDLVINNENGPAFVYQNNSRDINHNNYIAVKLKGAAKNTFAIGSIIKLYVDNQIISREIMPSRGFQSSMDYKQILGLGKMNKVDSMVIIWPNLSYSKFIHPKVDTTYTIQQPDSSSAKYDESLPVTTTLLDSVHSHFDKHEEDDYLDFYYERNVPEMLSREGPKAVTGDVNGDGLTDIIIGGTQNHPAQVYLQKPDGSFIKKDEPAFNQFIDFEDVAILLFDADKDGDLDLVIGPGGNANTPQSRQMQLRFFKNDGKGNFTLDASAFPDCGVNVSVITANDYDNDGDLDLFVGGRSEPKNYGISPRSFIFQNDGTGHFKDVTQSLNSGITNIGMVTGAVWANVKGDKNKELIVCGEWMSPRIFEYTNNRFNEVKTNLTDMLGWWRSISVADVNGDGKQDLILGNIGENFYLNPNKQNPVKLWINDFNQNGNTDKILTRMVDGKDMPVFLKRDLQDEVPMIKKQNLQHADFAKKSIQELFAPDLLNKSLVKQFNYTPSCIAVNNGNGNFTVKKLPVIAQLSSADAIYCTDINKDGKIDIIIGGNEDNFTPQFGRLDESFGNLLLNDGKGNFTCVDCIKSGLSVRGEVRDIQEITAGKKRYLLFLRNNDIPSLYKINAN